MLSPLYTSVLKGLRDYLGSGDAVVFSDGSDLAEVSTDCERRGCRCRRGWMRWDEVGEYVSDDKGLRPNGPAEKRPMKFKLPFLHGIEISGGDLVPLSLKPRDVRVIEAASAANSRCIVAWLQRQGHQIATRNLDTVQEGQLEFHRPLLSAGPLGRNPLSSLTYSPTSSQRVPATTTTASASFTIRPYTTMAYRNEADEIRTLVKLLEKGYIYRGLKPVNWCFDCHSALAEAEVEYEDRTDAAIDVGFPLDDRRPPEAREGVRAPALPQGPILAVIWTTTPWTIPANQALNVHPDFRYALVADAARTSRAGGGSRRRAASRATSSRAASSARRWARRSSRSASGIRSTIARRRSISATT